MDDVLPPEVRAFWSLGAGPPGIAPLARRESYARRSHAGRGSPRMAPEAPQAGQRRRKASGRVIPTCQLVKRAVIGLWGP